MLYQAKMSMEEEEINTSNILSHLMLPDFISQNPLNSLIPYGFRTEIIHRFQSA